MVHSRDEEAGSSSHTIQLRETTPLLLATKPHVADFLSLVGSSVLGFVLPALFHWIVHKEELGWGGNVVDWTIVVIACFGTWCSLVEIFGAKA